MSKETILIRCINTSNQKVKMMFHSIANNKQLMRSMGWTISDPQYEAKMEAIKANKPFSENGKAKEPAKESFIVNEPAPAKETAPKASSKATSKNVPIK